MGLEDLLNIQTRRNLGIIKTKNTFTLSSDTDEDRKLIEKTLKSTINSAKKRGIKNIESNIELKTTRNTKNSIRKYIQLFYKKLKSLKRSQKTIDNYIPKYELLIDYFNYKKVYSLNDITKKQCREMEDYLLNYPKNVNKYQELKGLNIFKLIDDNSPILDKYETLDIRTVDNYITRYKTLFNFLVEYDYTYTNYFLSIKNLKKKIENPITNFQKMEDIRQQMENEEIEKLLNNIKVKEIKNLIVLGIISGGRINELLNLKVEDIISYKYNYLLDIKKSKTMNGIRIIPLPHDFKFFIEELKKDKKDSDYLLFNELQEENRNDIIQKRTMYQIRKFISNKNKVFHSFRKNYTQQLYRHEIEELYIKLLLGHTLKDNLSFNVYNLSKIDNDTLLEQINKIDFKKLFINTEYYKKEEKEIINENISLHDLNSNIF